MCNTYFDKMAKAFATTRRLSIDWGAAQTNSGHQYNLGIASSVDEVIVVAMPANVFGVGGWGRELSDTRHHQHPHV